MDSLLNQAGGMLHRSNAAVACRFVMSIT